MVSSVYKTFFPIVFWLVHLIFIKLYIGRGILFGEPWLSACNPDTVVTKYSNCLHTTMLANMAACLRVLMHVISRCMVCYVTVTWSFGTVGLDWWAVVVQAHRNALIAYIRHRWLLWSLNATCVMSSITVTAYNSKSMHFSTWSIMCQVSLVQHHCLCPVHEPHWALSCLYMYKQTGFYFAKGVQNWTFGFVNP